MTIEELLGKDKERVVAIYPALRSVVTPIPDLIFVSQILFWARAVGKPFYKTNIELSYETGLTKNEIMYIKKRLGHYSFIKISYKGVPRKTYYSVDWDRLKNDIEEANSIKNSAVKIDGVLDWNTGGKSKTKRLGNLEPKNDSEVKLSRPLEVELSRPLEKKTSSSEVELSRPLDQSAYIPEVELSRPLEYNSPSPEVELSRPLEVELSRPLEVETSRLQEVETSSTLYREHTENTQKTTSDIIVANRAKTENQIETNVPVLEDKPQEPGTNSGTRKKYPQAFELLWSRYKPRFTKSKGNKRKAYEAYERAKEIFTDDDLIKILDAYMDSTMFELGQAHLSTFLNGIVTDTKYRDEFVDGGFEHRLERVKNKHSKIIGNGKSAQERYREDIAKQGELNANELIDRSAHISVLLSINHGLKMGAIEHGDRREWLPFLGPDYVAIPIKHPLSKTDKIKVLFHIDELRSNEYVHLHGYEWNEDREQKYQESNKGVEWIDTLQLPSKEEYKK